MANFAFFKSVSAGQVTDGKFSGVVQAQSNQLYDTKQVRNIIISELDPDINLMEDGDIWIKI